MAPSLRFKRYLRPVVVEGHGAYLFSEAGVTALRGSHVEALVPLLDGSRDLEALLRDASAEASPAQLAGLVSRLIAAGLVEESVPVEAADEQEMAYWEMAGLDANLAAERTAAGRANLIVLGGIDEGDAERALRMCGLRRATPPTAGETGKTGKKWCDLSIVLCDDYLDPALAHVDAEHRAAGRPWLLAKPTGATLYIGPVFQPGDGPCWTCMVHRLWANRGAEAQVQRALKKAGPAPRPAVGIGSSRASGMCLTMLEAAKWIAGHRHESQHDILTLDAVTLRTERHQLRRRPQCETCGDPGLVARQAWRAISPQSRIKTSCEGGGHRALSPERVLRRYEHLISPLTGLVAEIRRDPRGPEFLNAYVAGENPVHARASHGPAGIRAGMRALTGGKGVTPLHARASALCEALERRSGSYHGDELRLRASYEELGGRAVHPDSCQLYHERQFRDRAEWNRTHAPAQHVCEPFDPSVPIDWTPMWSLTHHRHRLVPSGMLYYGTPPECGRGFVRADSNGNAAGGTLEDALVQGFLELVERDSVALWWYNRTRQPGIDIEAFDDPWTSRVRQGYAAAGRELWALDLTADLGIPAMVALSRRVDKPAEDIVFGFGAHFDPRVALRRALTEMNQFMPAVCDARPDGTGYGTTDREALDWWRRATVAEHPYLLPDPGQAARTPDCYGFTPRPDLLDDVKAITDLVASNGMELLVLDQTRPDIELPVVKVMVPGLRHFWARFAPGRLYDVPVRLGRLAAPTPYADLNPIPLFV